MPSMKPNKQNKGTDNGNPNGDLSLQSGRRIDACAYTTPRATGRVMLFVSEGFPHWADESSSAHPGLSDEAPRLTNSESHAFDGLIERPNGLGIGPAIGAAARRRRCRA